MNLSLRTIATLVIAIVLGLLAIFAVNQYVNSSRPPPVQQAIQAPPTAGAPVVVAATKIERGVAIQPQNLKIVNYPSGAVPEGSFSTLDQLTGEKAGPRVAMHALVPGEPIFIRSVSVAGGHLNLSGIITPGMQAISIRSNELAGVAGFVLPGDHVDVLLTRALPPIEGKPPETVTQIVAQDVRVLGVDQSSDDAADKPMVSRVVTVEVTSSQAQSITLGQTIGTVSFALRHVSDPLRMARRGTVSSQFGYNPTKGLPDVVRVSRGALTEDFSLSNPLPGQYFSSSGGGNTNPEASSGGTRASSRGSQADSTSVTKRTADGDTVTFTTTKGRQR